MADPPLRSPSEEVTDLVQRGMNDFPELEHGAQAFVQDAKLDSESLFTGLVRYLNKMTCVEVRVEETRSMQAAVCSYDPESTILRVSEVLRRGSRNFQLAYQPTNPIPPVLERLAADLTLNATGR